MGFYKGQKIGKWRIREIETVGPASQPGGSKHPGLLVMLEVEDGPVVVRLQVGEADIEVLKTAVKATLRERRGIFGTVI